MSVSVSLSGALSVRKCVPGAAPFLDVLQVLLSVQSVRQDRAQQRRQIRVVCRHSTTSRDGADAWLHLLPYTGVMRIWLDLPDDVIEQLAEKGQDLSRTALEALAIDAYRTNRMTGHQLCQLLGIPSRDELDGFLKHHGVPLEYTFEDFEREGATSTRLWQKRQEELAADRDRERRPE
jgi:hypothetical protein